MVALARKNAFKQGYKPPQVVFIQTQLTQPLPVETASVDCILSNCVINLLPEAGKAALLKETYRVLKPGGRFVVDDVSPLRRAVGAGGPEFLSQIIGRK